LTEEVLKSLSDIELVNKAAAGDKQAFRVIVERHKEIVARVTISMLGNVDDADDVGQEVFIRFYKSMKKYKGRSSLSTYLVRIAINLSLNLIKKNNKQIPSYDEVYEKGDFEKEESDDVVNLIQSSLKLLEPEFRSVVVLRNIEGYSTRETAGLLKIPEGTVLSRLSRAHKKLKEIIKKLEVA
jgi:RNA polymerase sigma-70 factor (ECF subfamily)